MVENRTGARSTIAVDFVAKAAPVDLGYTATQATPSSHTIAPHVMKLPDRTRRRTSRR